MEGYKAEIIKTIGELDKRDRIRCKQQADCMQINEMFGNADKLLIDKVTAMATVQVHNEFSDNKDYNVYVLKDADGNLYSTSSESLAQSFEEVADETILAGDESVDIKVIKRNSKNANGGKFFTCTIA